MRTMHLLLGNSEGLLNNFIEVLVQDACAEEGSIASTNTRTIEGLILHGLTGRFDLMVVIPNNLVPDLAHAAAYDPFSEAAQAIRIIKKRCATPAIVIAAFGDKEQMETMLREAGADRVLGLPFHPDEVAAAARELLHVSCEPKPQEARSWQMPAILAKKILGVRRLLPAGEF